MSQYSLEGGPCPAPQLAFAMAVADFGKCVAGDIGFNGFCAEQPSALVK